MKLLRYATVFLINFLLVSTTAFAEGTENAQLEASRVERLVQLCKLWNQIKYFHPYLAYRNDIDWDAALVKNITKVNKAENAAEFGSALQSMLDALGDPTTRIVKKINPPAFESQSNEIRPAFEITEDNILIVGINRSFNLDDYLGTIDRMTEASREVSKAKGVILDLRTPVPLSSDQRENFQYAVELSRLAEKLSSMPLSVPGQRMRMHVGFSPQSGFQLVGFYSAFSTQDGRTIMPIPEGKDLPVIILVNGNSYIPIEALALQDAGKCIILAEENIDDSSIVRTEKIELNNEYEAQIRLSELVYKDGTTGILPNLKMMGDPDKTFQTALSLARDYKPASVARKAIPAWTAALPEKPYSEMSYPPKEYRLLAAFRIWGVINFFSPYKSLFDRDWDSVLKEFIPKMERAGNALEYSLALAEMLTNIHDSHTNISSPVLREYLGVAPTPVRVRFIEGLPVVNSFRDSEETKDLNLEIGDVILKVDGEDIQDRIARLKKYLSASTPQSLMRRIGDILLYGPDNSTAELTVRDRSNQVKEVKVPRNSKFFQYKDQRIGDILRLLPSDIGYADLDRLNVDMVNEMFEKFKDAKAIIFDLRGYPRLTVFLIAQWLTDEKRIPFAIFRRPVVTAINNSGDLQGSSLTYSYLDRVPVTGSRKYKGKTVMLIDDRVQSQAETTGLVFKAANGTMFIGSATAGTDGEVTDFYVPGGIRISFTGQELRHPDGKQLQRIGLLPDIEVNPTLKGIREGRDEVLETAIDYLTKELKAAKNKE